MSEQAYLFADWPAPANIGALTTLRCGPGVSSAPFDRFNLSARCGDEPAAVQENRKRLIETLALPSAPLWLRQVHGVEVVSVDTRRDDFLPSVANASLAAETLDQEPCADASVSSLPGTVLSVLTADCLPVLFCSEAGDELAAAHAGWRGLAAGVLEATVAAMRGRAETLLAWLGPAAGPQAYEVDAEVRDAFLARDSQAEAAFLPTRAGHWRIDLYLLARQRLASVGVDRVYGGGLCTISDAQRFYSYRRDPRSGRMASLIWRKD
jgi:YfiH family protein